MQINSDWQNPRRFALRLSPAGYLQRWAYKNMDSNYLINRIEDLESVSSLIPTALLREDLSGLVTESLIYVRQSIDIERLNKTLLAKENIDLSALNQVADIIENLNLEDPSYTFPSRVLNPSSLLQDYKSFVAKLSEEAQELDTMDLAIRLEFGSSSLTELLICAVNKDSNLTKLIEIVRDKLKLLSDDQVIDIWSRIQSEFSPERSFSMDADLNILSPDWLKTGTIEDTIKKIAEYIVVLKTRLMLTMFEREKHTVPSESPTLAQVLSLSASAAATPISQIELELSRSIARLYVYWSRILRKQKKDFHRILNLSVDASFLSSREHQGAVSREKYSGELTERIVLFELKKMIRASHSFASHETPIEKALMQYKLGNEVMTPEIIDDLKSKKELLLQKELCKFLLERNIFSVGTKFGRSEADLLAELPTEGFIIETKIYKEGKRVNERLIKSNLVQLQSYMDQSPVYRRGILVIFNFSSIFITAPRRWVSGRFWFLPINLQRKSPSSRDRSISIEPGKDDNLINVLNIIPPKKG